MDDGLACTHITIATSAALAEDGVQTHGMPGITVQREDGEHLTFLAESPRAVLALIRELRPHRVYLVSANDSERDAWHEILVRENGSIN